MKSKESRESYMLLIKRRKTLIHFNEIFGKPKNHLKTAQVARNREAGTNNSKNSERVK